MYYMYYFIIIYQLNILIVYVYNRHGPKRREFCFKVAELELEE